MKNCKDLLTQELKTLYPDVTDLELRQMTNNLIEFYTIAVEVLQEDEEDSIDDETF